MLKRLFRFINPIPAPIRRWCTPTRLLLCDLTVLAALAITGVFQAFVLSSPQSITTATALSSAHSGVVDPYRSHDNGHVWLTSAALVHLDSLPAGAAGDRLLLDAPATLTPGQRLHVHVSHDLQQVRTTKLPGPPVLPGGQGALLLLSLALAYPFYRRWQRHRRPTENPGTPHEQTAPPAPAQSSA